MRELTLGERLKRVNWLLFALCVGLALLGVALVEVAARSDYPGSGANQLRWLVIAIAACLVTLSVPYERFVRWRYPLYVLGIIMLVAVLVVGVSGGDSSVRRWISIGGFKVQPSEFMKVIFVIMLAGYFRYERGHRRFQGLALPFLLTGIPLLLIVKQPDLGTALLFLPVLFVLLYVAGAQRSHLLIVAGAGLLLAVTLYFVQGPINEYQKDRVRAFVLQDSRHPALLTGKGHQLHHSKTVVGSARVLGTGFGKDTAERVGYLSQCHTDFIFPVLVTSLGTLGAGVFLTLYMLFIWMMLRIALRVREPSGRLLAVAIATLFACQALINMGMTVGLLPVVGMPLPFISKGGSSLLTSFLALGLVLNVGADSPVEFGRGDFD